MNTWLGRVFSRDGLGGNLTVIAEALPNAPLASIARSFSVPDCGFIVDRGARSVTLRTFSPYEEIEMCLQTSMAAVVAEAAPIGEVWQVQHGAGQIVNAIRVEDGQGAQRVGVRFAPLREPPAAEARLAARLAAEAMRLGGARPRAYVECGLDELRGLRPTREEIGAICAEFGLSGIVWFALTGSGAVVRVFTTSLDGGEDTATGGAVAGIGQLLQAKGIRGGIPVVQSPGEAIGEGHMTLELDDGGVRLSGEVRPLVVGRLLGDPEAGASRRPGMD